MGKQPSKHIIDIAPIARIPLNRRQTFSYVYHKPIPAGSLVVVSMGRQTVRGVVVKNRKEFRRMGGIKLKSVTSVMYEKFLTSKQIRLATFLSERYLAPLGIVLKHFLLPIPKRIHSSEPSSETNTLRSTKFSSSLEMREIAEKILKKSPTLLMGRSGNHIRRILFSSIDTILENTPHSQCLLLAPDAVGLFQLTQDIRRLFPSIEVDVLAKHVSDGQLFRSWERIRSGVSRIIVGTRNALFAPYKQLDFVAITDESNISYKQWDMTPRYDARVAAELLAEMFDAHLVMSSVAPQLETWNRVLKKNIALVELENTTPHSVSVSIADIRLEQWKKNKSCRSGQLVVGDVLKESIADALSKHRQSILFVNMSGVSNYSLCAGCGTVLRCPTCDRALSLRKSGEFHCRHCSYKTDIVPRCQKCRSLEFKNVGLGTGRVEKELVRMFPSARIVTIDRDAVRTGKQFQTFLSDVANHPPDIIVGTQMAIADWYLPNGSLAGIIDAESLLTFTDFRSNERFFHHVASIASLIDPDTTSGDSKLVIQTFQPSHEAIRKASALSYRDFASTELDERKILNLPPFSTVILLIYQNYSLQKTNEESARVFQLLKSSSGHAIIQEPQHPILANIRGRHRKQIIIKIRHKTPEKDVREIDSIIRSLPDGWLVDVDPISIS